MPLHLYCPTFIVRCGAVFLFFIIDSARMVSEVKRVELEASVFRIEYSVRLFLCARRVFGEMNVL